MVVTGRLCSVGVQADTHTNAAEADTCAATAQYGEVDDQPDVDEATGRVEDAMVGGARGWEHSTIDEVSGADLPGLSPAIDAAGDGPHEGAQLLETENAAHSLVDTWADEDQESEKDSNGAEHL